MSDLHMTIALIGAALPLLAIAAYDCTRPRKPD